MSEEANLDTDEQATNLESQKASLYDQIGGEAAVDATVELFYRKVLKDYRINRFFDTTDMQKQLAKVKAFFTMVFGGPNYYTGSDLRTAHAPLVKLGLNETHFDIVMGHLGDTMTELGVADELIAQAAAIAESARHDVLGK